jgi:hypothetical protein
LNQRRLRVELAPSAFLTTLIVAAHAVAALGVALALPGAAGVAVALLHVLLGMASAWSRALLRARSSVRALELIGPKLVVELASGERFPAEVAERRYVGRFMVILPLRSPFRRSLLITRDMSEADSFRRLRIWALWGRLPPVAGKQLAA